MEVPTLKAKAMTSYSPLTVLTRPTSRSNAENMPSRPASPTKSFVTTNSNIDSPLAFRPKAKVNSSATTRKVTVVKASTSTSSTPRSRSPVKTTPRVRNGVTSPIPKTPSSYSGALRYPPIVSAPVTPERTSSLTTESTNASSSIAPSDHDSPMGTLPSLHHAVSFSSFKPTPNYSKLSSPRVRPLRGGFDGDMTRSPSLRIKSKVSTVAKSSDLSAGSPVPGLSPSSAHPSTRSLNLRTRTPSVSSVISQQQSQSTSPPPKFYPITTASPAANPYRYTSTGPPPRTILPAASQVFQHIAPKTVTPATDGSPPSQICFGVKVDDIQTKGDLGSNSAPPLSPPISAVSFSSRSSVSRSSASLSVVDDRLASQSTSTASSHLSPSRTTSNGKLDLNATLNNLIEYTSGLPSAESADEEDEMDEEHKVKAAAKSHRKIADLEITNRSLLAINATLEATKHRQAKEIRELKRKLRESRLILPPQTYREVKSSLEPSEIADDEEDAEDEDQEVEDGKDEIYHRISLLIDNLMKTGKQALEKQIEDFPEGGKGGAKVLTAEEVRDWHQATGNDTDRSDHHHLHDEHPDQHVTPLERDNTPMDAGDNSFTASEAEVEAMTLSLISSPSTPPPIFVTKPSQSCLLYS